MLVIIPPTYCVCHEPGDEEQVDAEGDAPDHQEVGGEDEHKAYQQLHPVLLGRVLATSRSEQEYIIQTLINYNLPKKINFSKSWSSSPIKRDEDALQPDNFLLFN